LLISRRYGIKEEDVRLWFKELEYAYQPEIDEYQILPAFVEMKKFGIIDRIPPIEEVCFGKNIVLIDKKTSLVAGYILKKVATFGKL
jgi:hypothetical protein